MKTRGLDEWKFFASIMSVATLVYMVVKIAGETSPAVANPRQPTKL